MPDPFAPFRTPEALELAESTNLDLASDSDRESDDVHVVGGPDHLTIVRVGDVVVTSGMVARGAVEYGSVSKAKKAVATLLSSPTTVPDLDAGLTPNAYETESIEPIEPEGDSE